MDIINRTLKELDFNTLYSFDCIIDKNISIVITINVFISSKNSSQVFLVFDWENSKLNNLVDGALIKEIARQFREKDFHSPEMDRNTSLLIISKCMTDEAIDHSSKIIIEDDPYYFKKYVFSYTELSEAHVTSWLMNVEKSEPIVPKIQDYITKPQHYADYITEYDADSKYAFFIELTTKICPFPMKLVKEDDVKTIDTLLSDEIEKRKNDAKKPIEIKKNILDEFIDAESFDLTNIDDFCQKWSAVFNDKSED